MTPHDTSVPPRLLLLLRELALALLPTLVINLLCALAVTYLLRIGGSFYENLQVSMCIGLLAMLLINGSRLLLWGNDAPNKLGMLLVIVVMAPLAVLLGRVLASLLMGQPILSLVPEHSDSIIAVIVLTFLVCFGATLFFWNRQKMAALEAHATQVEKQAVQAQLQMLQAQIEPHMLFNTLATLQSLISTDPLQAELMLNQLVQYLRTTLSASRADSTSLQKEFDLIKAYLGLMSLRMGMRLSYTLQLPEHLGRLRLAPMLLQPLVENAIKHGLEPKVDGGNCTVRAAVHNDMLVLSVLDTGAGLPTSISLNQPPPQKEPVIGMHFGLDNIRERLVTLYGPLAELIITHNVPAGAMAQITIPLKALKSAHRTTRHNRALDA
ncbi:sensor histidine kinase-like ATPase [Herbaspirillum frisingense GSF30]|uniref:Sensor histidine kinase-like ATPase n=1 Tax=Herbaspirillum frisingense GSF30 TaxID=864073 RepID=A0AAI9ID47_9BURK|nr:MULTISPECIES: histidine kinase [Herbaspirillum]EOA03900.1 sensor histidine kinase-like ATPase [Herbaspirillum frisingense GSF30]ONN67688.1 sensor histidine kinase [Herbaspirillum sp. VT-16-41]